VSSGTALAAMLRPAGLVLTPEQPAGQSLGYRISKSAAGRESWPIGWNPQEPARKVLPELFEFLNVEIEEIPLSDALDAIGGRLKVPLLLDRNALALHNIDPNKVEVSVPSKRLTYIQILQKVLFKSRLKHEVRVDEAGKPFLWITSVKQ
jgi:hypothetical protein